MSAVKPDICQLKLKTLNLIEKLCLMEVKGNSNEYQQINDTFLSLMTCHKIAEILLKLALNINHSIHS